MRTLVAALLMALLVPAHGGTRPTPVVVHQLGMAWVTGYTWTGYRTASGVWPVAGRTVAVDRRVIPFGAWIHIQGVGWRRAEDIGGAIVGTRLDVFTASVAEAYRITGWRRAYWIQAYG